jgi:hypothetical protein
VSCVIPVLDHGISSYWALAVPISISIFSGPGQAAWTVAYAAFIRQHRALIIQCTLQSTRFNQDCSEVCSSLQQPLPQPQPPLLLLLPQARLLRVYDSCCGSSFFVLLTGIYLSCDEAVSFVEFALRSMYALNSTPGQTALGFDWKCSSAIFV